MVPLISILLLCAAPPDAGDAAGAQILVQRCVRCHNAEKSRGGLDLSTRESALAGGATTAAIVPGDLEKSSVYQRAKDHSMPPPKDAPPLSSAEVDALARWITQGAPWPPGQSAIRNQQSAICIAVDSKSRRVRRWRRYGNVAAPLPQVALRPGRR
jgi:mono/diheme cytochrome c family protein